MSAARDSIGVSAHQQAVWRAYYRRLNLTPVHCNILDAAKLLSVGRSTIYKLMDNGLLESVKIGSRRLVRIESITAYADSLTEVA